MLAFEVDDDHVVGLQKIFAAAGGSGQDGVRAETRGEVA
jgi:hypothetical protein